MTCGETPSLSPIIPTRDGITANPTAAGDMVVVNISEISGLVVGSSGSTFAGVTVSIGTMGS